MRRAEIRQGLEQLQEAITKSEILKEIMGTIESKRGGKDQPYHPVIAALHRYALVATQFSDPARKLAEIMGLGDLTDPEKWGPLAATENPQPMYELHRNVSNANELLPKFVSMIANDYLGEIQRNSKDVPKELLGKQIFSAVLTENENEFSRPERLIKFLQCTDELYRIGL